MSHMLGCRLESEVFPIVLHQLLTLPKLTSTEDISNDQEDINERLLFARLAPLLVLLVVPTSAYASCIPSLHSAPSERVQFLYTCVVKVIVEIITSEVEFPRVRQICAQILARFDSTTTFGISCALLANVCDDATMLANNSTCNYRLLAAMSHLPDVVFNSNTWGNELWFLCPPPPPLASTAGVGLCDINNNIGGDATCSLRSANAAAFTLLSRIVAMRSSSVDKSNNIERNIPASVLEHLLMVLKVPLLETTTVTAGANVDDRNAGFANLQQGCVECLTQLVSWAATTAWTDQLAEPRVLIQQVDAEIEPLSSKEPAKEPLLEASLSPRRELKPTKYVSNVATMLPQQAAAQVIELMAAQTLQGTDVAATSTASVLCICACNALIGSFRALAADAQLEAGNAQQHDKSGGSSKREERMAVVALASKVSSCVYSHMAIMYCMA
jgi:hypothetical protein